MPVIKGSVVTVTSDFILFELFICIRSMGHQYKYVSVYNPGVKRYYDYILSCPDYFSVRGAL